jgi:hypothetical protein
MVIVPRGTTPSSTSIFPCHGETIAITHSMKNFCVEVLKQLRFLAATSMGPAGTRPAGSGGATGAKE